MRPETAVTLVLIAEALLVVALTVYNKYVLYQKTKSILLF